MSKAQRTAGNKTSQVKLRKTRNRHQGKPAKGKKCTSEELVPKNKKNQYTKALKKQSNEVIGTHNAKKQNTRQIHQQKIAHDISNSMPQMQ